MISWFDEVRRRRASSDKGMESVPEPKETRNTLVEELYGPGGV